MSARIACLALVLALIGISGSQSQAANLLEKNFWLSGPRYDHPLPPCNYPAALDRIIGDFQIKEARFWNSRLQIVGIENIQQSALLPWAAQSIPRRFCSGTAVVNDGARHAIFLLDRRRYRHDRHRLGCQFLRRGPRPQSGLRACLPRSTPLGRDSQGAAPRRGDHTSIPGSRSSASQSTVREPAAIARQVGGLGRSLLSARRARDRIACPVGYARPDCRLCRWL